MDRAFRCFALVLLANLALPAAARSEDGYDLWLRYPLVSNSARLAQYRGAVAGLFVAGGSPTASAARDELARGLRGLLGTDIPIVSNDRRDRIVLAGTAASSPAISQLGLQTSLARAGTEGYVISTQARRIVIAANTDVGVLHGAFAFLRLLQTHQAIDAVNIVEAPQLRHRILNHWDNLNGSVERGYAGASLWDWHTLPAYKAPRYTDYARANASLGINGTVLNNVNANALSLTPDYIAKAAALADVFRPYGIRVYLSARFSAPIEIGGLKTADPLVPEVKDWWVRKTAEIYKAIPDFGGFLVKANSEGQPGPQDYKRTHADGANMLADAVAPHGGIVMWRAFVYAQEADDRAKQAYAEFTPLDGTFRPNVLLQIKNGPIDFQPREPFSPLFGAMPRTPLTLELQITKEYLGFATHLAYLGVLFEEVLDADTYAKGAGSTVAHVVDGGVCGSARSGIVGVANVGVARDWTGAPFAQANWYAFGRLAWNPELSARDVAAEWLAMTFTNDERFLDTALGIMLRSREAVVDYMTPLGLAHLMGTGHHYGPAPWVDDLERAEWTPYYYHRAAADGIGFDRTASGSNAVAQYAPPVASRFANLAAVPDEYLLWFHRLRWDQRLRSGRTLWEELVRRYDRGVAEVAAMQADWATIEPYVDAERFAKTAALLEIQAREARWWRDACLAYFSARSGLSLPRGAAQPEHSLEYYKKLRFPYAPGR